MFLETMADLIGCKHSLSPTATWPMRPDVLKVSVDGSLLFLGEAKATERFSDLYSQGRLLAYLKWISKQITSDEQSVLFVLCAGRNETPQWLDQIQMLSQDTGLRCFRCGTATFGTGHATAWAYLNRFPALDQRANQSNSLRALSAVLQSVFPDANHAEAHRSQEPGLPSVSLPISSDLGRPEDGASLRGGGALGTSMPKAAVDENRKSVLAKENIWSARKACRMKSPSSDSGPN